MGKERANVFDQDGGWKSYRISDIKAVWDCSFLFTVLR